MATHDTVAAPVQEPRWKLAVRGVSRLLLLGLIFLAAGRLDWVRGWVFVGVMLATIAINLLVIRRRNPALLRERLKNVQPAKAFDKVFVAFHTLTLLAILVVAGLDGGRYGWSSLAFPWLYVGIALHTLGALPVGWAMATNPFLETTVRVQEERGHRVIATGPYRFVRHPMYVGIVVMFAGWPLIFGSTWTYVPIGVLALLLVFRAFFEDRTLRKELRGYEEYCRQTRYRLVPGVW